MTQSVVMVLIMLPSSRKHSLGTTLQLSKKCDPLAVGQQAPASSAAAQRGSAGQFRSTSSSSPPMPQHYNMTESTVGQQSPVRAKSVETSSRATDGAADGRSLSTSTRTSTSCSTCCCSTAPGAAHFRTISSAVFPPPPPFVTVGGSAVLHDGSSRT
jgi:hypothetical protein